MVVIPLPLHHNNNNDEEEEEEEEHGMFWLRALQHKVEMDELERALKEARDSERACRVMIGGETLPLHRRRDIRDWIRR